MSRVAEGIEIRHSRDCRALDAGRCSCTPGFRATAAFGERGARTRRTFPTLAAAKAWRRDSLQAHEQGRLARPNGLTVREAGIELLEGMRSGAIRNRSGDPYKAAVVAAYRSSLEAHLFPALGARRLTELSRGDAQALVERLGASGAKGSTVRNTLVPLRVIVRLAIQRGLLAHSPLDHLALPASRGRRERFASAGEALALIEAAPAQDRCLWAVFFFSGLRVSETRAIRPVDVDLAAGVIRVRFGWTRYADAPEPAKSHASARDVPIVRQLEEHLAAHPRLTGAAPSELLFATRSGGPIDPADVRDRARKAWARAGMAPITPHEARHTFASLMAAAGVPIEDLSRFMGHSSIAITADRYRHLYPEALRDAQTKMAALLDRADTQARLSQLA